ncbi:MAG: BrnT family toxin [Trueperaceae bacterium]|nr:BrnT family toxin [Trueperaceae bacterium]
MAEDIFEPLVRCTGFDWDDANAPKLRERHEVSQSECEQVSLAEPLLVAWDERHSQLEERWAALGRTFEGQRLLVVFTVRGERIHPVSARDMSRRERLRYAEAEAEDGA